MSLFRFAHSLPLRRTALNTIAALAIAPLAFIPLDSLHAQDADVATGSGEWKIQFVGRMGAEIEVENGKKDDQSRATFSVRNAGANRQVFWDIAEGVCGDNAQSIAPRASFRMIQTSMDGSGRSRVDVPRLESGKRYYARIFESASQQDDRSVQCANLSEQP